MGQNGCVTVAGPLWDPGFALMIAPGSTHRGCRNEYRTLRWSRGHRCLGTVTPPSGSVSPGAGSLRSHLWTHVPPEREWGGHTPWSSSSLSLPYLPQVGSQVGRCYCSLLHGWGPYNHMRTVTLKSPALVSWGPMRDRTKLITRGSETLLMPGGWRG